MDTSALEPYLANYRKSLQEQYDNSVKVLDQNRSNDYRDMMVSANRAGALYSNLPAQQKAKYVSSTYLPAMQTAHNTYQTGLDKIRSNATDYANKIKSLEAAIADLNSGTIISSNAY